MWAASCERVPKDLGHIFIDRIALAKQGDNRIGSVRPSVRLSVCPSVHQSVNALMAEPFDH